MFSALGMEVSKRRRVGMFLLVPRCEDVLRRAGLHHRAAVHHGDAVGQPRDDADVVADQHGRDAELGLQLRQQVHDLGLDRGVEARGRLVGDQERRLAGQRHGDHGPLAHAARQAVRDNCRTGAAACRSSPGRASRARAPLPPARF